MHDGQEKRAPGPDPERLKIDGDWEDAVEKSLGKGKPPKKDEPDAEKPDPDGDSEPDPQDGDG